MDKVELVENHFTDSFNRLMGRDFLNCFDEADGEPETQETFIVSINDTSPRSLQIIKQSNDAGKQYAEMKYDQFKNALDFLPGALDERMYNILVEKYQVSSPILVLPSIPFYREVKWLPSNVKMVATPALTHFMAIIDRDNPPRYKLSVPLIRMVVAANGQYIGGIRIVATLVTKRKKGARE